MLFQEMTGLDCQVLSHSLKTIEGFWHKFEMVRLAGDDPMGGFAFAKLETAILEGGRIARNYLLCYDAAPE